MCLSKHSPDAVVAHIVQLRAFVCLPVCVLSFFFALVKGADDPHRLKRATKSQVRSQRNSLSIHAVASLNNLLSSQNLRFLEEIIIRSHRK